MGYPCQLKDGRSKLPPQRLPDAVVLKLELASRSSEGPAGHLSVGLRPKDGGRAFPTCSQMLLLARGPHNESHAPSVFLMPQRLRVKENGPQRERVSPEIMACSGALGLIFWGVMTPS